MKNNKKGSSAVFLTLILATLVSITMALVYAVREESVNSRVDGLVNLAGDSVMSEFDYYVQKEYGLFLIKGTDAELSDKLRRYVKYSLDGMEGVTLERVKVSGVRSSLADTESVKGQIREQMKLVKAQGVLEKLKGGNPESRNDMEDKNLKHGPTIVSLPSAGVSDKKLTALAEAIAEKAEDADNAFREGTDNYFINSYILKYFNNKSYEANRNHFFKNEAEYVLGGELSDRKNEKRVEMALEAMRFPLNLAHIYGDPKKKAAVLAAAELLTPGPAAAATQLALATTWAYAESDNDVELLWQGYKVPMIKEKASWAMDLDSAVEGITGGTAKPSVNKGYSYEQYLQILLFFKDEEMKIARILDLVQINTRKCHNDDFIIGEYYMGIAIDVSVNGREYSYEKKY